MRIITKGLLVAAVSSLALSACGGSSSQPSGVSPLPNRVHQAAHVRPDGAAVQPMHAGGATFPAYAYNLGCQPVGLGTAPQAPPCTGSMWAAAGKKIHATIYYCLTGSGVGRKDFEGGSQDASYPPLGPCAGLGASPTGFGSRTDPPDFAGSDAPMPATEYPLYKAAREPSTGYNWGEPFEFPSIGGAIVYGYRPQDFKALTKSKQYIHLSTWTYCAITNGTISDWNDPAITADNGGTSVTGGVSRPITFYFRSDGSGTSFLFTTHLNAACNVSFGAPFNAPPYGGTGRSAAWSYGINQQWPGPGSPSVPNSRFIGESGNPGVLAAIQGTPFGTGYVEAAWAKSASPAIDQAWVQSGVHHKGGKTTIEWSDPTNTASVALALSKLTAKDIQYGTDTTAGSFANEGDSRPDCIIFINPSHLATHGKGNLYPIVGFSYLLFYGNNNNFNTRRKVGLIDWILSSASHQTIENDDYVPLSPSIEAAISAAVKGTSYAGENHPGPCIQ